MQGHSGSICRTVENYKSYREARNLQALKKEIYRLWKKKFTGFEKKEIYSLWKKEIYWLWKKEIYRLWKKKFTGFEKRNLQALQKEIYRLWKIFEQNAVKERAWFKRLMKINMEQLKRELLLLKTKLQSLMQIGTECKNLITFSEGFVKRDLSLIRLNFEIKLRKLEEKHVNELKIMAKEEKDTIDWEVKCIQDETKRYFSFFLPYFLFLSFVLQDKTQKVIFFLSFFNILKRRFFLSFFLS